MEAMNTFGFTGAFVLLARMSRAATEAGLLRSAFAGVPTLA